MNLDDGKWTDPYELEGEIDEDIRFYIDILKQIRERVSEGVHTEAEYNRCRKYCNDALERKFEALKPLCEK